MRYESKKTGRGNVGVSYVSAELAEQQAAEMDASGCTNCTDCKYCTNCTGCTDCTDCTDCTGCTDCKGCTDCTDCTGCKYCTDCTGLVNGAPAATPEQQVANLDKVAAIILDAPNRLDMCLWHAADTWRDRTCAEEAVCGTTHCLAGWLQVCATDPEIRALEPALGGAMQAPVAAKLFYRSAEEVTEWLRTRAYAAELGLAEAADAPGSAK